MTGTAEMRAARAAEVLARHERGETALHIGAAMGMTSANVNYILRRVLGPRGNRKAWTKEREALLLDMWRQGALARDIAHAVGMSRNGLMSRIERMRAAGVDLGPAHVIPNKRPRGRGEPKVARPAEGVAGGPIASPLEVKAGRRALARFDAALAHDGALLVPMDDLGNGCKWPFDRDGRTLFCGAATEAGASYCSACAPRATRDGWVRRESRVETARRAKAWRKGVRQRVLGAA